jgi:hypothetical protein
MKLLHGDCLDVLKELPDNSVDAVVTDPPYGLKFMNRHWDYDVPSVEIWAECLRVLKPGGHLLAFAGTRTQHRMAVRIEDAGFEIRDMIAWVYGSGFNKVGYIKDGGGQHVRKGWGGSLKPALEPICVARKPLMSASVNVLDLVESQLRERGVRGEILWKPESASAAEKSKRQTNSSPTEAQPVAVTSARNVAESVTQNDGPQTLKNSEPTMPHGANQSVSMCANTTSESATNYETKCLKPTGESAPAAESVSETFSQSTTSTAEAQSIGSPSTGRSTTNSSEKDSQPDTECFAGIATGLTGSTAHVHIKRDSSGFYLWPKGLPKFVAGTPLTVAENVLTHGTGALNIDGCRVPMNGEVVVTGQGTSDAIYGGGKGLRPADMGTQQFTSHDAGRWPANLIHDGSDEVVAGFPVTGAAKSGVRDPNGSMGYHGGASGLPGVVSGYDDNGGSAARFFYCAKASKSDRGEGNSHPTVKPTDLMRYLVRLVTPPGGVVLDPFMGSGSTGKAAKLEGFQFVGIEREAEYLEIAQARIIRGMD